MKKLLNKALIWLVMLSKRLLKKTGFLIILLLIPVLALFMTLCAQNNESSFLRIALYAGRDDTVDITDELKREESDMFSYTFCDNAEEALRMVDSGEADMAWVFQDGLSGEIERFVKGAGNTLVTVYEKEESAVLKLAREKIFALLYPYVCYEIYNDYIDTELGLPDISGQERKEVYYLFEKDDSLVEYTTFGEGSEQSEKNSYLTSPIKGMVSVLMLLCGLASSMYFIADEKRGTFSRLNYRKRLLVLWTGNVCALSFSAVFSTLAFILSGNYTSFIRESGAMAAYILICASFSALMAALIPSQKGFSVLMPIALVACTVFCPIFLDIRAFPLIQKLLPPYYYLNALSYPSQLYRMLIYFVISSGAAYGVYALRHLRDN